MSRADPVFRYFCLTLNEDPIGYRHVETGPFLGKEKGTGKLCLNRKLEAKLNVTGLC